MRWPAVSTRPFIKLSKTIYHHEHGIKAALVHDHSNARVEFINTMVRLITGPNRSPSAFIRDMEGGAAAPPST